MDGRERGGIKREREKRERKDRRERKRERRGIKRIYDNKVSHSRALSTGLLVIVLRLSLSLSF